MSAGSAMPAASATLSEAQAANRALLDGAAFERLLRRCHKRLERPTAHGDEALAGTVTLPAPTDDERRAIDRLLGRRSDGAKLRVALSALDRALVAAHGLDLRATVSRRFGPLRDRAAESEAAATAIDAALAPALASHLAAEPWFADWLAWLRQFFVTRLLRTEQLDHVARAVAVLEALPVDDEPIAHFASRVAGGTKALDGTPLERIVIAALARREGVERPESAEPRRALWERQGVVPDDLASQVLVLNLPAVGEGLVDRMARLAAADGVPLRLTLHQLHVAPPTLAAVPIYICENPAVLRMAAERLGAGSAALVATEGQPSSALWRLLRGAVGPLYVHADFDVAGLHIASALMERVGAEPWRFGLADYRSAPKDNRAGAAVMPPTPWSPGLAQAMADGVRVEEEQVVEALLADLAYGSGPVGPAPCEAERSGGERGLG